MRSRAGASEEVTMAVTASSARLAAGATWPAVGLRRNGRDYIIRRLLAGADALGIVVALAIAVAVDPAPSPHGKLFLFGLASIPLWFVV